MRWQVGGAAEERSPKVARLAFWPLDSQLIARTLDGPVGAFQFDELLIRLTIMALILARSANLSGWRSG
jgi:hypothetical protein